MAIIPTTDADRLAPQGRRPEVVDRSESIRAGALGELAGTVGTATAKFQASEDQFSYAKSKNALLTSDLALRRELEQDRDYATLEQRYTDRFSKARDTAAEGISSPRDRELFELDAEQSLARGINDVRGRARQLETDQGRADLEGLMADSRRVGLEATDDATRRASITNVQTAIAGAVQRNYLTAEQAGTVSRAFIADYGEGFLATRSLPEQLKLLRKPKGTLAEYIDPAKRAELARQIENTLRVQADRLDARGERAISKMDQQIASGVPMSPAVMAEYERDTKGTPFEAEFRDRLGDEQHVQEVLRLPVDKQLAEVQQREAKLLSEGGSIKDAANLQRLSRAVENNVRELNESPLSFYASRNGGTVPPLDIAALATPGGADQVREAFSQRAEILGALRKQYGAGAIPNKPLLPAESRALAATLERASPEDSIEVFAGLQTTVSTPEMYKAAVQQIAPDSPVTALAGMLAAKDAEITTEQHWFGPDKTLGAREVAVTMLEGERLLNPTKTAKGEDGKPVTRGFYLPETKTLQSAFTNAVGSAFASRPAAAENAFAAIQAYYVGKAAKTGRLASQSKDIDNDLVQESIKAVLGTVVDYNGNGQVFAPVGMSRDRFEDRIERAFEVSLRKRGLPDSMRDLLGNVGLRNAGDGTYYLTQGRSFVTDASGAPLTLDVNAPLTSGVSGTYDKPSSTGRW